MGIVFVYLDTLDMFRGSDSPSLSNLFVCGNIYVYIHISLNIFLFVPKPCLLVSVVTFMLYCTTLYIAMFVYIYIYG